MSGVLRIVSGLLVIGTAVYAGFLCRSPWIIVLLTLSFDAAWAAGEIRGDDEAFPAGLTKMIESAEAAGADKLAESEAAHKALARARTSFDALQQRLH